MLDLGALRAPTGTNMAAIETFDPAPPNLLVNCTNQSSSTYHYVWMLTGRSN